MQALHVELQQIKGQVESLKEQLRQLGDERADLKQQLEDIGGRERGEWMVVMRQEEKEELQKR